MKIYLDINGTIVYRVLEKGIVKVRPADHLKEFLQNALEKHDVYWLSTICDGSLDTVLPYLGRFLSRDIMLLVEKVKPTKWQNYKIEAIDLDEEFLWFDDVLMNNEREMLERSGKLDSFVRVNHYKKDGFFADWIGI